jgi:putative flippase GtrA
LAPDYGTTTLSSRNAGSSEYGTSTSFVIRDSYTFIRADFELFSSRTASHRFLRRWTLSASICMAVDFSDLLAGNLEAANQQTGAI